MRALLRIVPLLLLLCAFAPAHAQSPREEVLARFAAEMQLRDTAGFVETVMQLSANGTLPKRYITKAEASRRGWRPGDNLCRVVPGRVIGGDRFANREGRLPNAAKRAWFEADLDFACGKRGAKRVLWSSDGLIFVTPNHYESFRAVPK